MRAPDSLPPPCAPQAIATGEWVLIDVRRPDQFAVASPKGAVNVPLYRKIDMAGGFDAKKVGWAAAAAGRGGGGGAPARRPAAWPHRGGDTVAVELSRVAACTVGASCTMA